MQILEEPSLRFAGEHVFIIVRANIVTPEGTIVLQGWEARDAIKQYRFSITQWWNNGITYSVNLCFPTLF